MTHEQRYVGSGKERMEIMLIKMELKMADGENKIHTAAIVKVDSWLFFLQTPSEDKAKSHALIIPNLIVTVKPEQCFLLELFLRLPAQISDEPLRCEGVLWRHPITHHCI